MKELRYESPDTVEDAVAALARGDALPLAGGTDLIVQMREGRKSTGRIVDLKRIAELTAIRREADGSFRIGAAASFTRISAHGELTAAYPGIGESGRLVGSFQIQNRAGLGGNICNGAPSADAVPVIICLGAQAEIAGPSGRRKMAVEDLFEGPGRLKIGVGDVLVSVEIPPPRPRSAAHYLRFTPRREMDIAVAGSAGWLCLDADGKIGDARVVLASVAPVPLRARQTERFLIGQRPSHAAFAEAGRLAAQDALPISDTRGSAEYRRELVAVLTARVLGKCAQDLDVGVEPS